MPAEKNLQVEVVSHEGRLWHGSASSVSVPGVDGELGIRVGRQPLLAQLTAGKVRVRADEDMREFSITGGFASVDDDFVTVVADHATVTSHD